MSKINLKKDLWFLKMVNRGYLLVSKAGRVVNSKTGNILGVNPNKDGYHRISFSHKGKTRNILLHRLVWLAFKGLIPKGLEVNHKNGNKSVNKLSNFELVTHAQNAQHRFDKLGHEGPRGQKHSMSALTDKEAARMRAIYSKGSKSQRDLAQIFGVSQYAVYRVVNNLSYV